MVYFYLATLVYFYIATDMIYEDDDYAFFRRGYGAKGTQIPGLFVFSKKLNRWTKITKLSTDRAKLGRSPTDEEAKAVGKGGCSVGWDHSELTESDYVTLPLMTSGSVNFPDKIVYDKGTSEYFLQFNSSWNIVPVLTQFKVKRTEIDQAFEEWPGVGTRPDDKQDAAGVRKGRSRAL